MPRAAFQGISEPGGGAEGQPGRWSGGAEPGLVIASAVRLVREGLARSLRGRAGISLLKTVDFSAASLRRIGELRPDLVLVDLSGPDGLRYAATIRDACPAARVVAFAIAEVDEEVFACAAAGCCSYVPREGSAEDVYQAVLDAVEGEGALRAAHRGSPSRPRGAADAGACTGCGLAAAHRARG